MERSGGAKKVCCNALAKLAKRNNGLRYTEAEQYLLAHAPKI